MQKPASLLVLQTSPPIIISNYKSFSVYQFDDNRHLIADHLGWFQDDKNGPKTVEELVKAKGEKVVRGKLGQDGDIEITE